MFGSPDDMSSISHDSSSFLPTISDSDLVRDARHVHWQQPPFIPDTAQTSPHLHSMDSLIEPDGSSNKAGKGLGNVKAKMKAVVRLLSGAKERQRPSTPVFVSSKGLPIAGQGLQPMYVRPKAEGENGPQQATRVDAAKPAKSVGAQVGAGQGEEAAVIESLRERLASKDGVQAHPPPPPPSTPMRPRSSISLPPTAVTAKKRTPNTLGLSRLEEPRQRSPKQQTANLQGIRVASRPFPPTPALPAPSKSFTTNPSEDPRSLCERSLHPLVPDPEIVARIRGDDCSCEPTSRIDRFPSLHRAQAAPLDPKRLTEELESLASFATSRRSRYKNSAPAASSATANEIADSSREALCHWRPDEPPTNPRINGISHTARNSLFETQSSEEAESIRRIQDWRVHIAHAPSVLSKVASAHSFRVEDDGVSSNLTSVSRSPLSKRDQSGEQDPEMTPTLMAKRVVKLGKAAAVPFSSSHPKAKRNQVDDGDRSVKAGTSHIARLSDSQYDRLARATEHPPPPSPAPIPVEPVTRLHAHSTPVEEPRRSSLESAHPTTLSVLEKKASTHIDTLDAMIRRHPGKMYKIFRDRPGLMLVVLLRCRVEDRLSEVQSNVGTAPLVDVGEGGGEGKEDAIRVMEESLVGLSFDDEQVLQPDVRGGEVPSIVISRPGSGLAPTPAIPSSSSSATFPVPSASTSTYQHQAQGRGGEMGTRSDAALETMVRGLEKAGELCTVQQTLLSLQDKLMSTNTGYHRLRERLSVLEQAVFSPNNTPNTTASSLHVPL